MPGWIPTDNYQWEHWKSFRKLKTMYGKYLEDVYKISNNKSYSENNYYEIESLKNRTRNRRRTYTFVRNIFLVVALSLFFYLLYSMWTSGPSMIFK